MWSVCSACYLPAHVTSLSLFLLLLPPLCSVCMYMCICVCIQGDNEWKGNYGYISYFLVLLFWEVLPTYLVVIFFRVKLPCSCSCRCRSVSVPDVCVCLCVCVCVCVCVCAYGV